MKGKKKIFVLALFMSIVLLLLCTPAHSVLKTLKFESAGEPLVKTKMSIFNAEGEKISKEEEETDEKGALMFNFPGDGQYTFVSDDGSLKGKVDIVDGVATTDTVAMSEPSITAETAQQDSGKLSGTVTDDSGAAIPGVTVTDTIYEGQEGRAGEESRSELFEELDEAVEYMGLGLMDFEDVLDFGELVYEAYHYFAQKYDITSPYSIGQESPARQSLSSFISKHSEDSEEGWQATILLQAMEILELIGQRIRYKLDAYISEEDKTSSYKSQIGTGYDTSGFTMFNGLNLSINRVSLGSTLMYTDDSNKADEIRNSSIERLYSFLDPDGNHVFSAPSGGTNAQKLEKIYKDLLVTYEEERCREIYRDSTPQVLIESRIIETQDEFSRDLGATVNITDWSGLTPINFLDNNPHNDPESKGEGLKTTSVLVDVNSGFLLNLEISRLLESVSAGIQVSPRIVPLDKETTKTSSGTQSPYPNDSDQIVGRSIGSDVTQDVNNTKLKDVNIKIHITHQISSDGNLLIGVSPIGIFKNQSKIPFLSGIPIIGGLFKISAASECEELQVVVTPHIVR